MKKKPEKSLEMLIEETNDLLKKQLILQLAVLGVSQQAIRDSVKCDINYVNSVLKPLKGKIVKK